MRWAIVVVVCAALAVGCSSDKVGGGASYAVTDFVKFDGITYLRSYEDQEAGRPLRVEDLGSMFAEVRSDVSDKGPGYRPKDGDATYLKPGTPVHAVEGYDSSFRLAAYQQGSLALYEAVSNPKAEEGVDLLDIGGKVSSIDITHWENTGKVLGTIDDPERVGSLVRGLMGAPVEPTDPDHFGMKNTYQVVFHLEDGTAAARDYRTDTERLAPGIVTPNGFGKAIGEALEGFLKEQEALREATIAEEQREIRTCADARTTDETRTIDRGIPYTTNDVPGGPSAGVLRGTDEGDKLAGEDGEDQVYGLDGDDTLEGGVCDDEVYGGPGDDYVMGSGAMDPDDTGNDMLHGGPGEDQINGDLGEDVLYGGGGDDAQLFGYKGEDTIYGGDGNDLIDAQGDGQRDRLHCGGGRDMYTADEVDVVADDCEVKTKIMVSGGS